MVHSLKKQTVQAPHALQFPTHSLPLNTLIQNLENCDVKDSDAYEHVCLNHMPALLADPKLLPPDFTKHDPHAPYTKYTLYADKMGRFSIQVLLWKAGGITPIHSHKCWCGFGIYQGEMTEKIYAIKGVATPKSNSRWAENQVTPIAEKIYTAGDYTFYKSDTNADTPPHITDIHAMHNVSHETAISLHFYGINAPMGEDSVRHFFSSE